MQTRTVSAILAVVLAGAAAACGGGEPAPPASPSSAFPSGSSQPEPSTSGTDALPSIPADAGDVRLSQGGVQLEMSGDVHLRQELTRLVTGVAAAPPGAFALVWSGDAGTTTVGIGGASFLGTRPTTPTLVLTIAAPSPSGFSTWISSGGECRVTLETADASAIEGSFACEDLASSTGEVVTASGEFRAAR